MTKTLTMKIIGIIMNYSDYYKNLKESLSEHGTPILMIPEGQPEHDIKEIMMIPFDGSAELKNDTLGLSILMHHMATPSGDHPLVVLSSVMKLKAPSNEHALLSLINQLNFKFPMPGVMLVPDEHLVAYKFLIPIEGDAVTDSTLVLISEIFNAITSTLGIVADVASGDKNIEKALKEIDNL